MTFPNGANVLLLIRNGKANDLKSLCGHFGIDPNYAFYVTNALDDLERSNLITKEPSDALGWSSAQIKVTPLIGQLQQKLGISLTQLASTSADSIVVTPYFGRPANQGRTVDVFVLMPFSEELLPIYQDHIKNVTNELSLTCKRADDFFSVRHVMTDVWQGIWSAGAVIADCTGRNPNVFYEIGIAHTIGRPVILITQNKEDVPFDLQAVRYIQYEYTPRGMKEFEQRLRSTLQTVISGRSDQTPTITT